MSKTKEELKVIKEEVEEVSKKLQQLTDEELAQVIGGLNIRHRGAREEGSFYGFR